MLRLGIANYLTERYKQNGSVFLPDFVVYDFDEEEYQAFWEQLANHPKEQLYTDGINVIKVGRLRSLFELFKGFLGYENHCQANRVEMTLAKIAYAGYLKSFHAPALENSSPPISSRFRNLVNSSKKNQTSADLQQLLISYYLNYSHLFSTNHQTLPSPYPFGTVFMRDGLYNFAPTIDLQDKNLITRVIRYIHSYRQRPNNSKHMKGTLFAEAFAESLVESEEYSEALAWSPEVKEKFKIVYINFYFSQEEKDPQALTQAVELIAALDSSGDEAEKNTAVNYIKDYFNYEEELHYLKPYPQLRNKVALSYLADAKNEKQKWLLSKLFSGNNMLEYLTQVDRLDPQILRQDQSMDDVIMKDEWSLHLFHVAIDEKRFQEADALYIEKPHLKYDKKELQQLLQYYYILFSDTEANITKELNNTNIEEAEKLTLEKIAIAEKIKQINPKDALLLAAKQNYALLLLKLDKFRYPAAKDADLEQLDKAQAFFEQSNFLNHTATFKNHFNELLLRKIDCLIGKIGVPIGYYDHYSAYDLDQRTEFVKTHQAEIDDLKKNITDFIALNEPIKSKEMRAKIAKMYYILADTLLYFESQKQKAIPYFKKARELMPENLYYRVHYYELINHANTNKVRQQLAEIGHSHSQKYEDYMLERWYAEKILSTGFDIHAVLPEDKGLLNAVGKIIGLNYGS